MITAYDIYCGRGFGFFTVKKSGFLQLDNNRQFVFKDVFLKLVLVKLDYEPSDLHPIIDIP
jgi:hypothetical protein